MTNPYLAPVGGRWRRVAGVALLIAGALLTVALGFQLFDLVLPQDSRRAITSSSVIIGLILLALCGICWQAGYRLAFRRPDRSGTLFSRPAWFAIGTGLVVITALMATVIVRARRPTLVDVEVILFLGGIGVWCLVLAFRFRAERSGPRSAERIDAVAPESIRPSTSAR